MYGRLLVALDGSELAERVLPYVESLAERYGSDVTLIRVLSNTGPLLPPGAGAQPIPGAVIPPSQTLAAESDEAREYLRSVEARLAGRGITVDQIVREGTAAQTIVAYALDCESDLIAMTTHGRSGLGRVLLGSVAEEVVRQAPCPVLLVRAAE